MIDVSRHEERSVGGACGVGRWTGDGGDSEVIAERVGGGGGGVGVGVGVMKLGDNPIGCQEATWEQSAERRRQKSWSHVGISGFGHAQPPRPTCFENSPLSMLIMVVEPSVTAASPISARQRRVGQSAGTPGASGG
jgi:hypothetical protein